METHSALETMHFDPRRTSRPRPRWREARRALGLRPPERVHHGRVPRSPNSALQRRAAAAYAS